MFYLFPFAYIVDNYSYCWEPELVKCPGIDLDRYTFSSFCECNPCINDMPERLQDLGREVYTTGFFPREQIGKIRFEKFGTLKSKHITGCIINLDNPAGDVIRVHTADTDWIRYTVKEKTILFFALD